MKKYVNVLDKSSIIEVNISKIKRGEIKLDACFHGMLVLMEIIWAE